MSSEGIVVINPKGNNVDLDISFTKADGTPKKIKTLKPGEGCRVDKKTIVISQTRRPPRLLYQADTRECVPDRTPS